jgi:hypothetical protein
MIKMLLPVAVFSSVSSFAGLAMAQGQQGGALGNEVSAQCAHRRVMPPDPRDGCVRQLRSDVQFGSGGASATSSSQGSGVGPGNGGGPGSGIGPGNGGGRGLAKGR